MELAATKTPVMKWLFAMNIFISAFLIFFIQPVCAKQLLPFYGGSAFVWVSSVLFFQMALFLGYLYAYLLTRYLSPKIQVALHLSLLILTFYFIPLELYQPLEPLTAWPPLQVFMTLFISMILPLSLVCSSSPLFQHWYCLTTKAEYPYGYYAISNAGSMIGLFCYPLVLEIVLSLQNQFIIWSVLYTCFAIGSLLAIVAVLKAHKSTPKQKSKIEVNPTHLAAWLFLTFVTSTLLLSSTYYITQSLINMPLIWVVPLALYLLSFIITFAKDKEYDRSFWLQLFSVWLILFGSLSIRDSGSNIDTILVLFALMFTGMMVCHGELIKLKPHPSHLALYYLMIALGGVLGGLFVNFIAIILFSEWWDLYLPLLFINLLAITLLYKQYRLDKSNWLVLSLVVGLFSFSFYLYTLKPYFIQDSPLLANDQELYKHRNTYGQIKVTQMSHPELKNPFRILANGSIIHGAQFLSSDREMNPTTYYGPSSGVHAAFHYLQQKGPIHVNAIGMGTGTIASYTKTNDTLKFYEIDADIIEVGKKFFSFVDKAKGTIEIQLGDGRLQLKNEVNQNQKYDLIVIDAFSGDNIPFHLMTMEAMQLYKTMLNKDGIILFHITNTFVNLAHVTHGLANEMNYHHYWLTNRSDEPNGVFRSDWVLMSKDKKLNPWLKENDYLLVENNRLRSLVWTDANNSLLPVIRLVTN